MARKQKLSDPVGCAKFVCAACLRGSGWQLCYVAMTPTAPGERSRLCGNCDRPEQVTCVPIPRRSAAKGQAQKFLDAADGGEIVAFAKEHGLDKLLDELTSETEH